MSQRPTCGNSSPVPAYRHTCPAAIPTSKWESRGAVLAVAAFRTFCLLGWIGSVIYATQAVYAAGAEFPVERPRSHLRQKALGDFSKGRDSSDNEWDIFWYTLQTKLGYWLIIYIFLSYTLSESSIQIRMITSILMSTGLLIHLMGWRSVVFMYQQPVIYCILMHKWRNKVVIWAFTVFLLWLLDFDWVVSNYIDIYAESGQLGKFWFQVITAWNCARCISFCFDSWDVPEPSIWNFLSYYFYFPTVLNGPIVLYSTFQRDILQQQGKRCSVKYLVLKLLYSSFLILLCEAILHVLHFKRFTWSRHILWHLDLWALAGIMFWLGQFFMLKYMVMYGISTYIAQFDGLEMPSLPKCPSHIHRYSVLWKDFDRGLFDFLVRYTYVPTIRSLDKHQYTSPLHPELKKLLASILTFSYIYVWHGFSQPVQIWAFFNFIGITVERIGSLMKKKIAARMETHAMVWDLVIEPFFCVPLAGMSMLNSTVFLSNLTAAKIITHRFYSTWSENCAIPVLLCLTHVAVAIRTLPTFWPKLMAYLKPSNDQEDEKEK